MTKNKLLIFFLFGCALFVKAQNLSEWVAPQSAKETLNPIIDAQEYDFSIIEARYVFSKYCISCHGKKGKGDGKNAELYNPLPANLTSEKVQKQTDGEIFWKIVEGRNKMPSFKKTLDEEELWFLVNYIRNLAK